MESATVAAVVDSGDPEAVEELVDELEALSISAQLEVFSDCFDALLSAMDKETESREAAIRVVSALSPAMGLLVAETSVPDYATPGEGRFADAIDRQAALYVAALEDDDDQVREAAVRGIESFCVACRMLEDRTRLEALYDDLEAVEQRVAGPKQDHVDEAKEHAFSTLH